MQVPYKNPQTKSPQTQQTTMPTPLEITQEAMAGFEKRATQNAFALQEVKKNLVFMSAMTLVFQHCNNLLDIANLLKHSGTGGRFFSTSLEQCCGEDVATNMKKLFGDLFETGYLSEQSYLIADDAKVLLEICDFGPNENTAKTMEKVRRLQLLLGIEPSENGGLIAKEEKLERAISEKTYTQEHALDAFSVGFDYYHRTVSDFSKFTLGHFTLAEEKELWCTNVPVCEALNKKAGKYLTIAANLNHRVAASLITKMLENGKHSMHKLPPGLRPPYLTKHDAQTLQDKLFHNATL